MRRTPAVVIFGATASGKTDFVLSTFGANARTHLAGKAEVINADSIQVYSESRIASAAPDTEQLRLLPHHLVGVRNGTEEFSVTDFVSEADELCKKIVSQNKLPVIVGGTAFFLKHFLMDIPITPQSDIQVRKRLQNQLRVHGEKVLFDTLRKVDPVTAARINMHDHYRLVRALEIYETSGQPLSSFTVPNTFRATYTFLVLVLSRPREILYERINKRVDTLFDLGLVDEVKALARKGYTAETPIMKAIGYSEFFLNDKTKPDFSDIDLVRSMIKRNTRRYAKRQETFFKTIPHTRQINLENPSEVKTGIEEIEAFFQAHMVS